MNINISASSELMQNNMQADIMSPQENFQALQSQEGHTLFFSIGTDDIFYLTRETPGSQEGWAKMDLSSSLNQYNNGTPVIAKTFMVAQNMQSNKISIILAIQGETQDYIYTALGLDNIDSTWENPIPWIVQAYDDVLHPLSSPLSISSVYLSEVVYGEYMVVDIVKDPNDPNQFISTYFLDPSKAISSQVWNERDLAINLNAENVQRVIGIKNNEWVYATYTLGTTTTQTQLIYTPFYNAFDIQTPAAPTNLTPPSGASAIATVENDSGYTSLFVSGDQSLYYFPSDAQNNGDVGIPIIQHELFLNVTQLYANRNATEVVVWALNQQGQVFYTKCASGNEANSNDWSTPIPILSNVTQMTTYLNNNTDSKVLFAHTDGTNLIQLAQDPFTSMWAKSNIILPSTDMDHVLEYNTYTTHIQVSTEDNLPKAGETLLITSTSPVSVYINNAFTILSPTTPIPVATTSSGTITILQTTDTIGCVCYNVQVESTGSIVNINPMTKILDVMSGIQSGQDLANITVTNADGSTQALMPSSLTDDELDAIALAIQQFVAASATVPADGRTVEQETSSESYKNTSLAVQENTLWGLSFSNQRISFHSGTTALNKFNLKTVANSNRLVMNSFSVVGDIGDAIVTTVGDIFNWVQGVWDDVTDFFVQVVGDIYNCFITIAGKLYTFVLDCLEAILSVIQLIFDKIAILIEDLIKWVGFLFQWDDIIRTKDVFKNIILQYMNYATANTDTIKTDIDNVFNSIEQQLNEWANISAPSGGSLSSISSDTGTIDGANDPQSNFGLYHFNNGLQDSSTNASLATEMTDSLEQLFEVLFITIQTEAVVLEDAFTTFKVEVIDQISTLDISEIIQRTVVIISNTLLESINNILDASVDIVKILIDGVVDLLSSTINIPVLSWLYKEITGDELSALDAGCLVIAIPGTLLYKIARNETPFEDNSTTSALIQAKSWEELQSIVVPPTSKMSKAAASSSTSGWSTGDIIMVSAYYGSSLGSLLLIGTSTAKKYIKGPLQLPISILNGIGFFAATASTLADFLVTSSSDRLDLKFSRTIYLFTCLQRLADVGTYKDSFKAWKGASAIIDLGLGFVSLVPPIVGFVNSPSLLSASKGLTGIIWNSNRIMTPIAVSNTGFGIKMVLIGLYGVGELIVATEIVIEDSI